MSLDECAVGADPKVTGRSHTVIAVDDYVDNFFDSSRVFRFRGKSPGRNGGAVVVVQYRLTQGTLTAGVSICTPSDPWNPSKGIEFAEARMYSVGTKKRPNKWRFQMKHGDESPTQRDYYEFACRCLHHTFLLRHFSLATRQWFKRQLGWVLTGEGLKPGGAVTVR